MGDTDLQNGNGLVALLKAAASDAALAYLEVDHQGAHLERLEPQGDLHLCPQDKARTRKSTAVISKLSVAGLHRVVDTLLSPEYAESFMERAIAGSSSIQVDKVWYTCKSERAWS